MPNPSGRLTVVLLNTIVGLCGATWLVLFAVDIDRDGSWMPPGLHNDVLLALTAATIVAALLRGVAHIRTAQQDNAAVLQAIVAQLEMAHIVAGRHDAAGHPGSGRRRRSRRSSAPTLERPERDATYPWQAYLAGRADEVAGDQGPGPVA